MTRLDLATSAGGVLSLVLLATPGYAHTPVELEVVFEVSD
jgi:hypothetical protein